MNQNCLSGYPYIKVETTQKKDCVRVRLKHAYVCVEIRFCGRCVEIRKEVCASKKELIDSVKTY